MSLSVELIVAAVTARRHHQSSLWRLGVATSVVVTGTAPSVGSVAVFGAGPHLSSGLIAIVTAAAPVDRGTRLDIQISDPGTAYSDLTVQALPAAQTMAPLGSRVSTSIYDCDGSVHLDPGTTSLTQSLEPYLMAASKRAWFGFGEIWLGSSGLQSFTAGIEGSIGLKLSFGISGAAKCSLKLPEVRALVPTGPGGGVIFKLSPSLELEVSGAATVEASVELRCAPHYGWTSDSGSTSGSWCRPSHEPLKVNASNGVKATLGASMGASVTWNDIAGITGDIGDIGASITASYQPASNPKGQLSAKSDWNIGGCLACFWKDSPLNATFASGTIFRGSRHLRRSPWRAPGPN